jgi:hypothetical protein
MKTQSTRGKKWNKGNPTTEDRAGIKNKGKMDEEGMR